MAGNMVVKFCCTPVLFNEVQLTMVFWIEITDVATQFDKLLELWPLQHKIQLLEENAVAAAVGLPFTQWALESGAFAMQPICGHMSHDLSRDLDKSPNIKLQLSFHH